MPKPKPLNFTVKIGIEHERMIFDGDDFTNVRNLPQDAFPHDTLSCLAETRGPAHWSFYHAALGFLVEQARVDALYSVASLMPDGSRNERRYNLRHGEYLLTQAQALDAFESINYGLKGEKECTFNVVGQGELHHVQQGFAQIDQRVFATPVRVDVSVQSHLFKNE